MPRNEIGKVKGDTQGHHNGLCNLYKDIQPRGLWGLEHSRYLSYVMCPAEGRCALFFPQKLCSLVKS